MKHITWILSTALLLSVAVFSTSSGQDQELSGRWTITIQFLKGTAEHQMTLIQNGSELTGSYQGQYTSGEITGTVTGSQVEFFTLLKYEGSNLQYKFSGELQNGTMSGTVDLGEYWSAEWKAEKI